MKLSENIKPISYFKAHAAEVLDALHENQEPYVLTVNGEAKAVLLDVRAYEQMQETMAMLVLVAHGEREIAEGKVMSVERAFQKVRSSMSRTK